MHNDREDIWFTWNTPRDNAVPPGIFFDETLRDGLQAANIPIPTLEQKLRIVDHMARCGIRCADLGFPGSSPQARQECTELARHIAACGYPIVPGYAGRTHPADIEAIRAVAQDAGSSVDAYLFIGVSPIRQYVEDWSLPAILGNIRDSAAACERDGLEFVLVLEDTVRCTPDVLRQVYDTAIDVGVRRVTLCDTVGAATPEGTRSLILWSAEYFTDRGHPVGLEWHGHNDRGLALANSLTALEAGCVRVHGTILGVGERAGNTSLDQLLLNSHLFAHERHDLLALREYCEYAATVLEIDVPENYPAMGRDVFKTSAGVHATAILKAHEKGDVAVKDSVYSGVPASLLGRQQEVLIDSSSGANNVRYWLTANGFAQDDKVIRKVLETAKADRNPLDDERIRSIIATVN
ncbi:LeuA family protein [Dactylosporangium sp. CA-092794]|uniref:LeuA family protein n=1 Tax=Dactylosporangium sp. CA-092794 TaxID=3239929 RepID=UPI003D92CFAE